MKVLVSGATGLCGRHVVSLLGSSAVAAGRNADRLRPLGAGAIRVIDLTRPETLRGVCDGIDAVVCCSGASLDLRRRSPAAFADVDDAGNAALLEEAVRSGTKRFVYVSVAGALALRHTDYMDAHERFVERLQRSGLAGAVVRPTGFFGFFTERLRVLESSRGYCIGDGQARTNPIHEADVARACVDAVHGFAPADWEIGGPEIFTRSQLAALPLVVAGLPARVHHVSESTARSAAKLLGFLAGRRVRQLLDFAISVSLTDVIAPAYGVRRLADYFREALAAGD